MILNEEKKFVTINIKDIKSFYIIKNVFSFLDEKRKLNIIIYNKKLQKILLIDLNDYKKIIV